jgi:putative mRNA 3-end processing factor
MVKISFLGSCREVGRSAILIESKSGEKGLLDYGVRFDEEERLPHKADLQGLKFAAVSHCHVDHSGALPSLYRNGSPILFTNPLTLELIEVLLKDMIRISSYPYPFGYRELNTMKKNAYLLKNQVKQKVGKDFYITFFNAGHVPGSVSILIEVDGKKILYTGDLNTQETNLIAGAQPENYPEIDSLIIESTYALRDHPNRFDLEKEFMEGITTTIDNGGRVLIPAFGVARSQEALMILQKYNYRGKVFLDGLAKLVSKVYMNYPNSIKDLELFKYAIKRAHFVNRRRMRSKVKKTSSVIISPSGMLKGGAAMEYIKPILKDPNSAIYLVGYQVEGTPGRELVDTNIFEFKERSQKRRSNYNINIEAQCDIGHYDFSSHADRKRLENYVSHLNFNNSNNIFCVHGDNLSTTSLAKDFVEKGYISVAPEIGESYSL